MAKILIELYSKRTPENLISILKERCDGVLFFSFSQKNAPSGKEKDELSKVIRQILGFEPKFSKMKHVSVEAALTAFENLPSEDQYEIDITGGDETFVAAAGIFAEKRHSTVSLHKYDIRSGRKLFRYPTYQKEEALFPRYLSAPQILALGGNPPLSAPSYSFTVGPLKEEVLRLWECVKKSPKEWNRFCSLSADAESGKSAVTQKCIEGEGPAHAYASISKKLKSAGIITGERKVRIRGRNYMEFSLNVAKEAEFLYDKAGNILEMYAALAAHEAGVFHDIRVGVMLDWNGKVASGISPDPRNEVDLVLMHENLPVVASCKNTLPQNEHLYEIMIMAKHYGGYFSTPMLLSSGRASPTVRERAKEMGILLIDGIRYLSPEALSDLFQKYFPR